MQKFSHWYPSTKTLPFFKNDEFTFNGLSSDVNFCKQWYAYTVVVNFDNFCKIRLRFDRRHKAEATLFVDSEVRDTIWLLNNCSDYIIKDQWTPN